jgi:ubiquinone biosynthesis protein
MRKAYGTALRVMLSYAWLWMIRRFISRKRYESRMLALHIKNAVRVKNSILALQGLFIKVGQLLSILSNFFPPEPLEALQDQVPGRPIEEVKARIRKELGKNPEEIFQRFDEMPLAAASIGQAHRACLPDGTEVVVKVQHANIEDIAQVDLDVIRRITRIVSWFFDIKGMDYLYTQIRKMIEEELDFSREMYSMQLIAANLREETGILVPQPHPDFSTKRVLTTTWHDGVKISNLQQLDQWGIDRQEMASRILKTWCRMIFKDGVYHADPHPGNLLVQRDGQLVLLDFGAVATLHESLREGIPKLIEAAIRNDTDAMIDVCRSMGFIAQGREAAQMAQKMIEALRNFLQNEVEFEGMNLKELKIKPFDNSLSNLISDIGFRGISGTVQVPKDYVLLNRAVTLLLGLSNSLAPQLNPLDVIRPYAKQYVMGEKGSPLGFVTDLLRRTLASALSLPDEVRRTLKLIQKGEVEVQVSEIRQASRLLYRAAQQIIYAFLAVSCGVFAYILRKDGDVELATYASWVTLGLVFFLFRSMWGGKNA